MASESIGPGRTIYFADGERVYRRLHNDPAWINPVSDSFGLTPERVARMMQDAYERGRIEQRILIRDTLGIGGVGHV